MIFLIFIFRLREALESLKQKNTILEERVYYLNNVVKSINRNEFVENNEKKNEEFEQKFNEKLSTIFTPTQIKILLTKNKHVAKWTNNDISSAISLRSISPKAYRFLLKMHHPLPGDLRINLYFFQYLLIY